MTKREKHGKDSRENPGDGTAGRDEKVKIDLPPEEALKVLLRPTKPKK